MSDTSMLDLFKMEVEQQTELLNDSLLALDQNPTSAEHLEAAMRASHSVKGAARLLGVESVQGLAHMMEDCLVAAQEGRLLLDGDAVDVLLKAMDAIRQIAAAEDNLDAWLDDHRQVFDQLVSALEGVGSRADAEATPRINVAEAVVSAPETPTATSADIPERRLNLTEDASLLELFRVECEQHGAVIGEGLLTLEQNPTASECLDQLMRAAHSIKGAARLVGIEPLVEIAHAMEDGFVAAQNGELELSADDIDVMLKGLDVIQEIAAYEGDLNQWYGGRRQDIAQLVQALAAIKPAPDAQPAAPERAPAPAHDEADISLTIGDPSMLDLFRVECEQHGAVLNQGLLALEQDPTSPERLEPLMRAAHSIKGAARLVGIEPVVKLAHAMEDGFVAAQNSEIVLSAEHMDVLLKGADTILAIAMHEGELADWYDANRQDYLSLLDEVNAILKGESGVVTETRAEAVPAAASEARPEPGEAGDADTAAVKPALKKNTAPQKDRVLRVSAELVNRLMGLAGESLVESRWLYPYSESLRRLKRQQTDLVCMIDSLRERMERQQVSDDMRGLLRDAQRQASQCREVMSDRLNELESYDRRLSNLSSRLHREVVGSRMRPFIDGVHGFPRMVRDISRSLKKDVQLIIEGETTMVDRDILDKIEAPLNHIIRNAIDHGLESPEERVAAGKPAKGTIRLRAYHNAGMLSIVVGDDGRGIDLDRLRHKIVEKGLIDAAMAETLSEMELTDFLFLPGFSTKDKVSEISGRGVGLDVVYDAMQEMRGNVRATSKPGQGTRFHMQLPLTLSVIPALLVEIAGEPYAFPLARIDRIASVRQSEVSEAEGNQFVVLDGKNVGLVSASQILEKESGMEHTGLMSVVVLNERNHYYGMVVDKFLGERELVVQVMPEALGKVQDISSAALMEDGSPLLIVDVDDLIRSIEKVLKTARLGKVSSILEEETALCKTVLVVDDSITVREVERKLLERAGYQVETAVDGVDGLNMLRSQPFDMLVTDVDMPRMNGIDLVKTLRQDASLRSLPVLMVSYKDREEDKLRGLEAGADYYLTKGSFHDETLLQAVVDLVGEAKS
jgi:two-component system sensor histidine kinase and response regulator WspE